jgi:hypothetical protein
LVDIVDIKFKAVRQTGLDADISGALPKMTQSGNGQAIPSNFCKVLGLVIHGGE